MKKFCKKLSVLLILCLALTVAAGAAEPMTAYVIDELDLAISLPEEAQVSVNETLDKVYLEFVIGDYEKTGNVLLGSVGLREDAAVSGEYAFSYSWLYDEWYEGLKKDEQDLAAKYYEMFLDLFVDRRSDVDVDVYENDQTSFVETVVKTRVDGKTCRTAIYTNGDVVITFVTVGKSQDKTIKAIMDTVRVNQSTWSPSGFSDVAGHWAEAEITEAVELGLFDGTGKNTFSPDAGMTRAMLVQVLYRMEKEPKAEPCDFTDVAADAWYADAVAWAAEEEIVLGIDGKFRPDDLVTREQLAAILWRYAKYDRRDVSVGEDTNILSYNDAFEIAEYAIPAVQWACGAGLISGDGEGWLMPQSNATRAQVAAILVRYLDK